MHNSELTDGTHLPSNALDTGSHSRVQILREVREAAGSREWREVTQAVRGSPGMAVVSN